MSLVVESIEKLSTLKDVDSILENSALIYAHEGMTCKKELANILRFQPLSIDQLANESRKINTLISGALESNTYVSEVCQQYMVDMDKLVRTRIDTQFGDSFNALVSEITMMESEMFDPSDKYEVPVIESLDRGTATAIKELNIGIEGYNKITPMGIINSVCEVLSLPNDQMKPYMLQLCETVTEKVKNTIDYEKKRKSYSDLPILEGIDRARAYLKVIYADKESVVQVIESFFDTVEENLTEHVTQIITESQTEESFVNPFDVYNLCPFPVGQRKVERAVLDVMSAETDKEICESLLSFERLHTLCETFSEEILTEAGSNVIAKKAREISRKVSNKGTQVARNIQKAGHDAKVTAKKAIDPMERFIESTYQKYKEADENERRNMVIKGSHGMAGAVRKIMHWVVRGIQAWVVGGVVGYGIGPILGGITFIGMIVGNKYYDSKARRQVLNELEQELTIVNEKIEDSRGDEDKSKKYELMRIKNKLESEIERIRYRL